MGGTSNNLYPPNVQNMSLHPPDYDPRRLFPFGLSPIPEVPSELASEVSSIASSPTPSYEDSDTEAESMHSRSRGSIMYSGSCDSVKSNETLHGKRSSSESSSDSDHDSTEEETEDEQEAPDIPIDNTPIVKEETNPKQSNLQSSSSTSSPSQSTLYNSEVTQVMHQRTFINSGPKTPEPKPVSTVERKTLSEWTQENRKKEQEEVSTERSEFPCDMMSGAATASEIFRHLQATRGKQEVTTELAKILTVLKTTLQTESIDKGDSSSSDEESGLHRVKVKEPMLTGKPPRPPIKNKIKYFSTISPAIQAKIKELENSKSSNPKEEMSLLSKILVHLLCSCKTVAAAQELKGIIKQFKEVAKVAMEEGDDTLELLRSNSRASSRNAIRRKVRSRTASGNSNISANSETDSLNTLTPGDSKSSGTDDETGQDPNLSKIRFTSDFGGRKDTNNESCVSYTLTLPLNKAEGADVAMGNEEAEGEEDDEWEWEYDDESAAVTPTKLGSSGSSRNLTPSEGKSDVSTGSTRKLLTEMEMGAYNSNNSSSTSHSEQNSNNITGEEDILEDDEEYGKRKRRGSEKGEGSGHIFCHLEETFKVLSDTYKIITTGNSPECENDEEGFGLQTPDYGSQRTSVDESFEDILDGISNQCVQLETEITRSSRESSVRQTPIRQCTASPVGGSSPAPPRLSRPGSSAGLVISRPGSRLKLKTPLPPEAEDDWGDEDDWEYYYEGDDWDEEEEDGKGAEGKSRPPSRQKVLSRPVSRQTDKPLSRPVSRQTDKPTSRPVSRQTDKPKSRPVSRQQDVSVSRPTDKPLSRPVSRQKETESAQKVLTRPSSRQLQPEQRPLSKAASRPASRAKEDSEEGGDWEWDDSGEGWGEGDEGDWEYEYYYEEEVDSAGNVTSRPVSRARIPSRQGGPSRVPSRVASRAPSRADEVVDHTKGASRTASRHEIQGVRVPSRQMSRVPSRATGDKPPSRAGSRNGSRPVSRAKTEGGGEDDEDGWEYYYEEDYHEEGGEEQSANHNEVSGTACSATSDNERKDDIPSIVINPTKDLSQRPSSRNSQHGSRPSSRTGSRPNSRPVSRQKGRKGQTVLGNVEEEDEYYDDDYVFNEDDMYEMRGSSPTLTTAPTTRATSPSMVFPGEKETHVENDQQSNTGFTKRRISVIDELDETSRPGTVEARTPTNRGSATPQIYAAEIRESSKTPSFYQSQSGEVGYLNPMAGVSVALAAEYLGQDAQQVVASLPADFIEENQVLVKERKKKKHRSKDKEQYDDDEDDEDRKKRKKKGRKKDGKFLPKVGVKELAARMEGELFQDMQVGTKMAITRDEVREVIRESKKKVKNLEALQDSRSQQGTPNRYSPNSRKEEDKRKSVREMVQLMSAQLPMQEEQNQGEGGYSIAVSNGQQYSIPNITPSSSQMPPPIPPLPQGYYSSPTPQYPQQYQPYPVEVRPQYPPHYMAGHESPYQQYPPQQYQQYQQQYHPYQGYPPPPPQHYQYPPQQYQQYPQPIQPYPQGYQSYPPPQQSMVYNSDNSNQVKVVTGGQTTMVTMRSKSQGGSRATSQRPTKSPEMHDVARSPVDSEAYGTGSTGSDGTEGQVALIDHDEEVPMVDSMGNPVKKRHSRLFKLLQDSDYTDSDTESRSDYSRISMKNVEDHHGKESDIDSVCSGLERTRDKGIDRKHSFRSHKSSNKESDNESVTSSGVERKISPNSMQKNLTTRRFMQLSLKNDYEPSSSELSTPNSPTAIGPDDKGRRKSTSKPPARVWNYHADDFDTHAGVSDDSSYQSLQSLNSFDSIYDTNAGLEVEEILKMKVHRDNLSRYQTDSPASYVTASPKTVDMLRNSPKTHSASPRMSDPRATASPKFEQELMELANFPSSPSISLRQLHSHRGLYGGGGSK